MSKKKHKTEANELEKELDTSNVEEVQENDKIKHYLARRSNHRN